MKHTLESIKKNPITPVKTEWKNPASLTISDTIIVLTVFGFAIFAFVSIGLGNS